MILKEKFSLSLFLSPTTPKNVFSLSVESLNLHITSSILVTQLTVRICSKLQQVMRFPASCSSEILLLQLKTMCSLCRRNHVSAQTWQALPQKKCLQNFQHPYILSFTITSVLLFSTVLTKSRSCNCENFLLGCISIGKVTFSESWFQVECGAVVEVNG